MSINTINVNLIDNNEPVPKPKIVEPFLAYHVRDTLRGEVLGSIEIPNTITGTTAQLSFRGNKTDSTLRVINKRGDLVELAKAETVAAGKYTVSYDATTDLTTMNMGFATNAILKGHEALEVHEVFTVANITGTLTLLKTTYESTIKGLLIDDKDKKTLTKHLAAYFDEEGLGHAKLFIFQTLDELKAKQNEITNYVIVLLNIYSDKFEDLLDSRFFYYATYSGEAAAPAVWERVIAKFPYVAMFEDRDNLLARFAAKYHGEMDIFLAVNPYGIKLKMQAVSDATKRDTFRKNFVNFYSLLNETKKDGVTALKEGVFLNNKAIDEVLMLRYIKDNAAIEAHRIWNKNNRNNSKLSSVVGRKPNDYQIGLTVWLSGLVNDGILNSYTLKDVTVKKQAELYIDINLEIVYNYSINSVKFVIQSNPFEGVAA